MANVAIHPAVDKGVKPAKASFAGGTLACLCSKDAVTVAIKGQSNYNHVCRGVARQRARHGQRRQAEDRRPESHHPALRLQGLRRSHVWPHREPKHPLFGFDFIHTELSRDEGWAPAGFAAFVSSIIESGADPKQMGAVRARLKQLGLEPYDCLSPPLMDAIATHTAKASGVLKS